MVFKTIQNKMHWANHGETAAETVYKRVDSTKEHVGLTKFKERKILTDIGNFLENKNNQII